MARLLLGGNFAVPSIFPSTVLPPSCSTSSCSGLISSIDDFTCLNFRLSLNHAVAYCIDNGTKLRKLHHIVGCARGRERTAFENPSEVECLGTGLDVECVVTEIPNSEKDEAITIDDQFQPKAQSLLGAALLISPFFFWGTAMVAMKEVIPQVGPFAVAAFRLVPAGFLLVAFAAKTGRPMPSGFKAWLSIILFAFVDGSLFQGFLAEGLQRTAAGLGSVIIDSQPLTVAILAALFFGESIGYVGAAGLVLGLIGLLLLELPGILNQGSRFSLWGSGEWWMLLAAQSMAAGTLMVRWVSKYSDPIMATGWHMVIGGVPLAAAAIALEDPSFGGSFSKWDVFALVYASVFGGAVSYGVYFYNATRGSLTKLSSLTFLTPMFASLFGFVFLGETFTPLQFVGVFVTIVGIYMVNL